MFSGVQAWREQITRKAPPYFHHVAYISSIFPGLLLHRARLMAELLTLIAWLESTFTDSHSDNIQIEKNTIL